MCSLVTNFLDDRMIYSSPVNLVIFATALKCRRQVHSRRHLRQKKKKLWQKMPSC